MSHDYFDGQRWTERPADYDPYYRGLEPGKTVIGGRWIPLIPKVRARQAICVIDTETTGIPDDGWMPEVWQIGAVRTEPDGTRREFNELLALPDLLPDIIVEICGVPADLPRRAGRPPAEVLVEFTAFVDGAVPAGHNWKEFDRPILAAAYVAAGIVPPAWLADDAFSFDTLWMSRQVRNWPGAGPWGHSLAALVDYFGLRALGRAHDALVDADLAHQLLAALEGLLDGALCPDMIDRAA